MSYSISISGHKQTDSEEHSRAFEREQLAVARDAVRRLDGVGSATFYGGYIGSIDLLKPADETQPTPNAPKPPEPPKPEPAPAPELSEPEPAPEPTPEPQPSPATKRPAARRPGRRR